jgi:prolyl 4-hydroxylase
MSEYGQRDITQWLADQIRAGHSGPVLLQVMVDRGWNRDVANGLIAEAMSARAMAGAAAQTSPPAQAEAGAQSTVAVASAMPALGLERSPLYVDAGDRRVSVLMSMPNPQVVLFGDFLNRDECERLVETARPRMERSLTTDMKTGDNQLDPVRTSRGMFFQRSETPLVRTIEKRIEKLIGWPLVNGEHLQVLHYRPGDKYEPHYDYFNPDAEASAAILARGGQRIATFLMYLREPEAGGETIFPHLGLRIAARRGYALYFAYDRPHPSTRTLHGGAPVLAGEKWVATKWLREREFV